jgi:hypothetical protein
LAIIPRILFPEVLFGDPTSPPDFLCIPAVLKGTARKNEHKYPPSLKNQCIRLHCSEDSEVQWATG